MTILSIRNLEVYYGKINALKKINLRIFPGQLVCLIGANGAGKTTLLNAISGMLPAESGSIEFNGREILNEYPHVITKSGIAHIPEGRKIFSELTVEENLLIGAYVQNNRSRVSALLESSYDLFPRLAERRNQEGGSLSGGEQQMLAIARGLMCDPELILLDEPSLGLAPLLVERIFELIAEINQRGISVLLVEQNANIALQIAQYAYVIESGKISIANDPMVLLEDPQVRKAYFGIG